MRISRRISMGGMVFAAAISASGHASSQADVIGTLGKGADALSPFKWKNRPVLLFADSEADEAYRAAVRALAAAEEGLTERDIVVLADTDPSRATALRQRLHPSGFTMILVGKDGGMKLMSGDVIPVETLFETIDAMPMRQNELRND